MEGDVVLHQPTHRLGRHVDRGIVGNGRFDVARVAVEPVFPGIAEISVVLNPSAGRTDPHQRSRDGRERNVSAYRINFHVPITNAGQGDRSRHRFHVHVAARHVFYIDRRVRAFRLHVAVQALCAQGAGGRLQIHAGIRRHQHFVIDARIFRIRSRQQMRLHIHPVPALVLIDFNFVGVSGGGHGYEIAGGGLYRHAAELVDD